MEFDRFVFPQDIGLARDIRFVQYCILLDQHNNLRSVCNLIIYLTLADSASQLQNMPFGGYVLQGLSNHMHKVHITLETF
jgi:hypothetical protein